MAIAAAASSPAWAWLRARRTRAARRGGGLAGGHALARVIAAAAVGIAQHLPGGVESHDPLVITAGIGMVTLHQGPVGGLDLGGTGLGGNAQHPIGVA